MNYHFDVELAVEYGVNEAIMIQYLQYWIIKNQASDDHFYDGRTWTYNSVAAFMKLFPFWSKGQINRILIKLIDLGIIIKGNYNKTSYDRTSWYAFVDEAYFIQLESSEISRSNSHTNSQIDKFHLPESLNGISENEVKLPLKGGDKSAPSISRNRKMDLTKSKNRFEQNKKPIPVIKPIIKPNRDQGGASTPIPHVPTTFTKHSIIDEAVSLMKRGQDIVKLHNSRVSFDIYQQVNYCLDIIRPVSQGGRGYSVEEFEQVLDFLEDHDDGEFKWGCQVQSFRKLNLKPKKKSAYHESYDRWMDVFLSMATKSSKKKKKYTIEDVKKNKFMKFCNI